MSYVSEMLQTHPQVTIADPAALAEVLDVLAQCSLTCLLCADACLAEEKVEPLRECIRRNLDCASACETAARALTRQTLVGNPSLRRTLEACVAACTACAAECEQHAAHMEHCRVCAEACRACADACARLLKRLPTAA